MWFRILGGILVIAAATALGYQAGGALQERVDGLEILRELLQRLRGEISYGATPLGEAFYKMSQEGKEPFCQWLVTLSESLSGEKKEDFATKWSRAVEQHLIGSGLTREDLRELKEFGRKFGIGSRSVQLGKIVLYQELLARKLQICRKDLSEGVKVRRCVGILLGIFTVILFF